MPQQCLFDSPLSAHTPPSTRYQGSKLKLLSWIWEKIQDIPFRSALDAFGGTGVVSYLLKDRSKQVTYNDNLRFNHLVGTALIENAGARLSEGDVEFVLARHRGRKYADFIARTYRDTYFTEDENEWLDIASQNIPHLADKYKRAVAYFGLFQSCIAKRPYNLFHRKNLYIRTADVKRGFGNKATWDKPFVEHFRTFVAEANGAIFDSGVQCQAICKDAMEVRGEFDLVYIDPPYVNQKGPPTDYLDFYHFLEGLVDYDRLAQSGSTGAENISPLSERDRRGLTRRDAATHSIFCSIDFEIQSSWCPTAATEFRRSKS